MPPTHEVATSAADPVNSRSQIQQRMAAGRVSWIGPLLLLPARTVLLLASQGLMALVLLSLHRPRPWREAGDWWSIYGTLVDIGCLIGLRYFTRREGIRLRDLIGPIRLRYGRDVWLGLGYFLLVFPLFFGAGWGAQKLLYAPNDPALMSYYLHVRHLPLWAIVYSVGFWWILWSATEEATYQAYILPRLQALTGRNWVALLMVGFWFTAQHCALGFVYDWKFILFRFLAFLPGCLALSTIYLRNQRLAPNIIAHWPMDIAVAIMIASY